MSTDVGAPLIHITNSTSTVLTTTRKAVLILTSICVAVVATVVIIILTVNSPSPGICEGVSSDLECSKIILRNYPLIDGHNDLPIRYREDFDDVVMTTEIPDTWQTNMQKIREGLLGAQFWSVYVPCTKQGKDAVRSTYEQIDVVHKMVQKFSDTLILTKTSQDIISAFNMDPPKVGSLMGVEGAHQIEASLGNLRMMYNLGVRYMTLAHTCNNEVADSEANKCADDSYCNIGTCVSGTCSQPQQQGISAFGVSVINEMNRIGMLVDISHISHNAMRKTLSITKSPVIFSHSNAYSLCNNTRNVPDDVLYSLKENRGIIMVTFVVGFLTCTNNANISDVVDHIDYIAYGKCPSWKDDCNANFTGIGVDYIGIGSDFDGVSIVVEGLESVATYPDLIELLLLREYSIEDIRKIIGGNLLRVLQEAEKVSQNLAQDLPNENWLNPATQCRTGD